MLNLLSIIRGGFLRERRAEVLGIATAIAGLAHALASWAVGDLSIFSLTRAISENWALIAAGLGLATLGDKIERQRPSREAVSDIAAAALRR